MNDEKETEELDCVADGQTDLIGTDAEDPDTADADVEEADGTDTDADTDAEETEDSGDVDTDESIHHSVNIPARIAVCALALVLSVALAGYVALALAVRGPSELHRENTVTLLQGSGMGRFLLTCVMSDGEIAEVESAKADREALERAEAGLLKIEINDGYPAVGDIERPENNVTDNGGALEDDDGIEIVPIKTESYKGTLMIVDDPKRIFVGAPEKYGNYAYGLKLRDMIRKYDAVGGINAGGFIVVGETQTGGVPMGFVIKDSKVIWAGDGSPDNICGFDCDGKLVVGTMSPYQAVEAGVVDAVSFGPALIIDGKPVNTGHWLGVQRNARTAIGQRADGAMLLLVIEGRHIASFGAYFTDVIDIMLDYGAVNATNLDGGYSTFMVYDEENLDMKSYAYGERYLPSSILVRKK